MKFSQNEGFETLYLKPSKSGVSKKRVSKKLVLVKQAVPKASRRIIIKSRPISERRRALTHNTQSVWSEI